MHRFTSSSEHFLAPPSSLFRVWFVNCFCCPLGAQKARGTGIHAIACVPCLSLYPGVPLRRGRPVHIMCSQENEQIRLSPYPGAPLRHGGQLPPIS